MTGIKVMSFKQAKEKLEKLYPKTYQYVSYECGHYADMTPWCLCTVYVDGGEICGGDTFEIAFEKLGGSFKETPQTIKQIEKEF